MTLQQRVKSFQEPLLKALVHPRAKLLPHDARTALAELSAFLGELVAEIEALKRSHDL